MARALPIREIFVPFLLLTAALVAGCASVPGCASAACEPTSPPGPPVAPSGLTAVLHPDGALVLEWSDNSVHETAFVVVEDCGESRGRLVGSVGRDQTRVAVEGMDAGSSCSFAVFAANAAGLSRPSNVASIGNVSAEIPPDPPGPAT